MKDFYVYELIDPRNDNPFYIGKGSKLRMYYHVHEVKRNRVPNGNINLEQRIKEILQDGLKIKYNVIRDGILDEKESFELERKRISEIGIDNLCNCNRGGYGGYNLYITEETRKKMSDAKKGKPTWNKGKTGVQVAWNKGLTKETNDIVKKYSEAKIGQKRTEEQRQKISKSKIGSVPWNKGKKGLQVPWNKGLTMNDERVRNNVEKMIKTRYGSK